VFCAGALSRDVPQCCAVRLEQWRQPSGETAPRIGPVSLHQRSRFFLFPVRNSNDIGGTNMGYGLIGILVIVLLVAMIFYFVRRA
jgi:hypothetical protein